MLFTLLETVRRFEFGPYGELMLMADDGMVIEAERPLSRPAAAQN
jgi:hypothetical protein